MRLSIVIPIYNVEPYLKKCLDSVLHQTITDWECILVDDGSTDNSGKICDEYVARDSRFKVIHKSNEGSAVARNLGIYLAKGKWIGFVDADDWIEPNRFKSSIELAINKNVSIVQCSVRVHDYLDDSKIWHLGTPGLYRIEGKLILSKPLYDIGHCWDKIYEANLIKKNHIEFANCDMCEDTLFNAHAITCAGGIYSQGDILYHYVIRKNSLAHSAIDINRMYRIKTALDKEVNKLDKLNNFKYIKSNLLNLFDEILARSDKIDYVFPYVDCTDINWINEYRKYNDLIDPVRFDKNILLKYKFRAISKWMDWINNLYMIVSSESQVPDWVNRDTVKIILHSDIIPHEYLPTFNSCTIEMFLHNIPNLSEKFIYGNDDMYANFTLKPKFFFHKSNKLRVDLSNRKLWHKGDINKDWACIPINSLKLAAKDKPEILKKYIDGIHLYELQHIDKPMFKSINEKVFKLYKDDILNSITRFRSCKNLNQYLFTEYALFHGSGDIDSFRYKYRQVGIETNDIINSILAKSDRCREICCNSSDSATLNDYNRIKVAFDKLYPNKCKYEVDNE